MLWVFCFSVLVKWNYCPPATAWISTAIVIAALLSEVAGERWSSFDFFKRLEWITYDFRTRLKQGSVEATANNLGIIAIKDESLQALLDSPDLPFHFSHPWPRQVYGRLLAELRAQGAKAVGFDIIFADPYPEHPLINIGGQKIGSDDYFAQELAQSGNVILAADRQLLPLKAFRDAARAVGNISAETDSDSILRKVPAFSEVDTWHPALQMAAREFGWKLTEATKTNGSLSLPRDDKRPADLLPLNEHGYFNVFQILRQLGLSPNLADQGWKEWEPPSNRERFWQMGIVLAAAELDLDLEQATVDSRRKLIHFPSKSGTPRTIPIDADGKIYVNWSVPADGKHLTVESFEDLLIQHEERLSGRHGALTNRWAGKLITVGSIATGNNMRDVGATPLSRETFLMSVHWNVANSVITNQFIQVMPLGWRLVLIACCGLGATIITQRLRAGLATLTMILLATVYCLFAIWAFAAWRWWLPVVLPIGISFMLTHAALIAYLAKTEQRARHQTMEIFNKLVSPAVASELVRNDKIALKGARREVTVIFADVRNFTEISDLNQQRAESIVSTYRLSGREAEQIYDQQSEDTLTTVNLYLETVSECIKRHGGTVDKFIGDCVMGFWGAPLANPRHASCAVLAMMEMQQQIWALNEQRHGENQLRETENIRRATSGAIPIPKLDILKLGTGINTGLVTVGLMGSNYTVFGREVNLAARLENASGKARILIGQQTYEALRREAPELALTCVEQPPLRLKGFRDTIRAYEVPWQTPDLIPEKTSTNDTLFREKDSDSGRL